MSQVEIAAKISVDSANAGKSINDLQNSLKEARNQLNNAKIGSQEYTEAQKKVKEATDELNKSQSSGNEAFGVLKERLFSTVPGLKAAESGTVSLQGQLLKLAANPIVLILTAIVLALKFLYEAFTYTVGGAKQMQQIFAGLQAVFEVIVERLMGVGQAIIKLFSGDWKGAAQQMKESFTGIGDAVKKAYDEVSKATEKLQQLKKEERLSSIERAKQNAAIVESKELLNDENATILQKREALKKVSEFEIKIGKEDVERAKQKFEQQKIIWGQTKEGLKKHADELADLEKDIYAKEEETSRKTIQIQRQYRTLDRQEKAEAKEAEQKEKEERKQSEEERKTRLENYRAYQQKIDKLMQDEHLSSIKDQYKKEEYLAEIKIAEDKKNAQLDFENKKINRQQLQALLDAFDKEEQRKKDEIEEKRKKDLAQKTLEFERELNAIKNKITLDGIKDNRERETMQMNLDYQSKRQTIMLNEKTTFTQKVLLLDQLEKEYKQQQEIKKLKEDKEDAKNKLAEQKALANETKLKFAQKRAELDVLDQMLKEYHDKGLISDKEYTQGLNENKEARKKIDKEEFNAKIELLDLWTNALNGIADIVGKQTAAGKAISLASALISTYEGIAKGVKLGFPQAIPAVLAASATGFKAVQSIINTPVPGQGGGGSAPSGISTSAPLIPRQAMSTTSLSGQTLASLNATASRAYVVESDIANNQQRIQRINRAARLV